MNMTLSNFEKEKRSKLQAEAKKLYKKGFSLRKVASILDKSHEWVRTAVSVDNLFDKEMTEE